MSEPSPTSSAGRAHHAWLRSELPALVERGVLDAAAAERLRAHYGLDTPEAKRSYALIAFAILGAGLIGGGVSLLVAHNWDELGRPARAALCFLLLLVAQGLAGYALVRRASSAAWQEGSALFLTLSLGASMSLVSQTYHAQGELGDLVLGWVLLGAPMVYLLRARVACVALLALSLVLPLGREHALDEGYAFFATLLALAPFVLFEPRLARDGARTGALVSALAFAVCIGLGMLAAKDAPHTLALLLVSLYVFVAVGAPQLAAFAPRRLAAFALGVHLLVLSFEEPNAELHRVHTPFAHPAAWLFLGLSIALALAVALMVARMAAEQRREALGFALALLPMWASFLLGFGRDMAFVAALGFNVFVLGFGLDRLLSGLRALDRVRTNYGLFLLSGLFTLRFLDSDLSFVVRGLGMIAVGVAFLAINVYLSRRAEAEGSAAP